MAKKKQVPTRHPTQVWKLYEVKGDQLVRKNRFSPKAGDGVFMAKHKNRESCGKTGYTEFSKKE